MDERDVLALAAIFFVVALLAGRMSGLTVGLIVSGTISLLVVVLWFMVVGYSRPTVTSVFAFFYYGALVMIILAPGQLLGAVLGNAMRSSTYERVVRLEDDHSELQSLSGDQ